MGLFNRKPQPSVALPRSSKPSQKPSAKPAIPTSQAITEAEAKPIKQIFGHAKAANLQSGEALGILQDMMAPTEGENSQLAEVKGLLRDLVEKIISLEASMDTRLSAIESKMPALRVVSRQSTSPN